MKMSLAGQWKLCSSKCEELSVTVPGSVLSALLEHKLIEDPFVGENEAAARAWLYDDYTFFRTFSLTPEQLEATNYLCFDGIDTVAKVELNEHVIADLRDMHTPQKILLDNGILSAENEIRILFTSPYKYIEAYDDQDLFETYAVTQPKSPCIRKANYMFGWDWGPDLADMGIAREVSILSTNLGCLKNFRHTVTFCDDGSAKIDLDIHVTCLCSGKIRAELSLDHTEHPFFACETALFSKALPYGTLSFRIPQPQRWNPIGFGEPTLYDLKITLTGESGEEQTYTYRIGLREIKIDNSRDEIGTNFSVSVNGKKIFLTGASYIPEDSILSRITPERTKKLLTQVRDFGHNTVRVWGGGYYPTDDFYDFCDENGILVWQDLMFACAAYNISDADFRKLITEETIVNVERFRHHASVFIISGDNECEDGINGHGAPKMENYRYMSEEILQPLMHSLTDTYFLRTSPRSAELFHHQNDLEHYDTHYWHVWGDEQPVELYETVYPRMLSEVGHSAFPCMDTVKAFAAEKDFAAESPVMQHHQKRPDCNGRILRYIREQYGEPKTFEDAVYLSQTMQAEAIRMVTEHMRRHRDICNGVIYWQLNDCWPGITWSSVDYFGHPKALHYASRRFFAPHLISMAAEDGKMAVVISNDSPEQADYTARVQVMRLDGTVLTENTLTASVPAGSCKAVQTVPVPAQPDIVVWATLMMPDGTVLCENYRQPKKDREVRYEKPHYTVKKLSACSFELTADTFTKYISLHSDEETEFSDNFFTLRSGETKRITTNRPVNPDTLQITSVNQTQAD